MDIIQKELESRREEIKSALEGLFKLNLKITDWDVPEANDKEASIMLLDIIQEELDKLKEAVKNGTYDNY